MKNDSTIQRFNNSTSSEIAIKVENVSKKFCKSLKRSMLYGVKDIAKNTLGMSSNSGTLRKKEFWAVDNISFEVKKGETLGIIGPNGSGKTTILKMLNGIFWPDKGKITIKGKTGALISVGAGFHPMLTGRENIYLNGAILGMSRDEVSRKFDDIVEFADIGDFLDTPVKFYSSGMFVRLGFSVAVHCDPDVLLVDEVLSVGDEKFRRKAFYKMEDLLKKATIVIVSHNLFQINKLCNKVIYLNGGIIKAKGNVEESIAKYYADSRVLETTKEIKEENTVKFEEIYFENSKGKKTNKIALFEDVKLVLKFRCAKEKMTDGHFSFRIYGPEEIMLSKLEFQGSFPLDDNSHSLIVYIKKINLSAGNYRIEVKVSEKTYVAGIWYNALAFEIYTSDFKLLQYRKGYFILDAHGEYK
jgi:lipopolysaccharide transport system ATP-binding protein